MSETTTVKPRMDRAAILKAMDDEWRSKPPAHRVAAAAELIEARAKVAMAGPTAGEWVPEWDSCDCEYGGCSCGSWICAVRFENAITEPPKGKPVQSWHKQADTEIPSDAMVWMLTLQPAVGALLVDLLESNPHLPAVVAIADAFLAAPVPDHEWHGWPNAVAAGLATDPWTMQAQEMGWIKDDAEATP